MSDKGRITIMVCTGADGSKVLLSVVGKSKTPECLRRADHILPPLHSMNLLYEIRSGDDFINKESIVRCWRDV